MLLHFAFAWQSPTAVVVLKQNILRFSFVVSLLLLLSLLCKKKKDSHHQVMLIYLLVAFAVLLVVLLSVCLSVRVHFVEEFHNL